MLPPPPPPTPNLPLPDHANKHGVCIKVMISLFLSLSFWNPKYWIGTNICRKSKRWLGLLWDCWRGSLRQHLVMGQLRGVVWFRVKGDGGWDDRYDKAFAWYAPCFHWSLPAVVIVYVYGDPANCRTVGARTRTVCLWKQMREKTFLLTCTSIVLHCIYYIPWKQS